MKITNLHSWRLSPSQAKQTQLTLAPKVITKNHLKSPKIIAGTDISFNKKDPIGYAGVVLLDANSLEIIQEFTLKDNLTFPYIPGLLSFREGPLLIELFKKVHPIPDLIFFDGQGIAHPRRFGLASHLGLFLDCPTIGCAKSRLVGSYEEPGENKGSFSKLIDDNGKTIGAVIRTKENCKPLYISQGHKINLKTATKWTLECTGGYRIPEPTRLAHLLVNRFRKQHTKS